MILAAVVITMAHMARAGMAIQMSAPFCISCKTWAHEISAGTFLNCPGDALKQRLLARDFSCLRTLRSHGGRKWYYVFDLTFCRCDGIQRLEVAYDPDPGGEAPREPVLSMGLTKTDAQAVKRLLPTPGRISEWMGPLLMAALLTGVLQLCLMLAGFNPIWFPG